MGNDIKTMTFIANEMTRQVKNNLQFVKNLQGEDVAGRFTDTPKKGETIQLRKQARMIGRDGETFTEEDYIERLVDVSVQQTAGVDLLITNRQLMFELDQIAERVVKPAAETLANKIDRAALVLATNAVANGVGTPGAVPTALKTYNQARAKMSWEGCPQDGHSMLISPDMQVEAVDAGKTFFTKEAEDQYSSGILGRHSGAKVYECQNLVINTTGPLGGTPLVDGAAQGVSTWAATSTINLKGWTAAVANRLKKGNRFTIAGVYAVNPWTRETTGALREFVAVADKSSLVDGTMVALSISPAMVISGPYQNVTGSPADSAAITVAGAASTASPQGLRFHRDAFVFGTLDQPEPTGAVVFCKTVTDPQTGIKIRYIRDWDTKANKQIDRFDCVWVFGVAFPEWASRIAS
jgi:hypothetical protein